MKKTLEKQDAIILLETGTNKQSKILIPNEDLIIGKTNAMKDTEKDQYQHNGSGTAILVNKYINHIPTRDLFNNPKIVTRIIINPNKSR